MHAYSHQIKLVLVIYFYLPTIMSGATWYVATNGNDNNNGKINTPFKTLKYAISKSSDGDVIELRNGTYPSDEIKIERNDLTIRSYVNEWAIIKAPVDAGEDIASCLWYSNEKTRGGTLERLEIIGGAFYGVKFESNWNWGLPDNERSGASGIKLVQCKIHDTGRDCIKITPGCNDISIISCEIYNSGVGPENLEQNGGPNAEGIDNVNGSRMIVKNSYFHEISTNGVYAKGGAVDCVIEGNLFRNIGEAGIGVGFYTDGEWFDSKTNPNYYESINTIVRNNIVINTQHGGIVIVGAKNCKIYNNTVMTASPIYHAPLTFLSGEVGVDENTTFHPISTGLEILNNIFIDQSPSGEDDFTILVRENALEGSNIIDHNIFYKSNGSAISFDDGDWPSKKFADWKTLGFDSHGLEVNPQLNAEMHLLSSSPAIDKGKSINGLQTDYDGKARLNAVDIGADEFGNGNVLQVPPPTSIIGTGAVGSTSNSNYWNVVNPIVFYPNPADDLLHVSGMEIENYTIQLFDLNGKLIISKPGNSLQTEQLISGLYLVRAISNHQDITNFQKILIHHPY